ncbi:transporter substrate-binding domain-containing protein [Sanguibacter sp. 25GB23B1]|uniref:transporter substrate-binding domain-containing protein n=1 Tax=unclassified Sanguibacter TaxID=2645534 RepID=UPI0032B008A2
MMGKLLVAFAVLCTSGCASSFPADPDGTLDRVTDGVLRVGVSPNPPWTVLAGEMADPEGLEVDLVEDFAASIDADIEWTPGGEGDLMDQLERSELDLVVGGLTAKSPWASHAALTYPYTTTTAEDGTEEKRVMAAPLGENAFLVELEAFLLDQEAER